VLYEAVTGRTPFSGDSPAATALVRLHRAPTDLRMVDPHLSEPFCAAVMRNLDPAPERRFQSALDFGMALANPKKPSTRARAEVRAGHPSMQPSVVRPPAPVVVRRNPVVAPPRRSLTGRLVLTSLTLGPIVLAVALVIAGASATTAKKPAPAPAANPARLVVAHSFDPLGKPDRLEDEPDAAKVLDNDPTTMWSTEHYNSPTFGTKPGLGIVLQLESKSKLDSLHLEGSTGWDGVAYVLPNAPTTAPVANGAPLPGGALIDGSKPVLDVPLGGRVGSYVLIWITRLGTGKGRPYVVQLSGASVVGHTVSGG
jgi:hypothetical protein